MPVMSNQQQVVKRLEARRIALKWSHNSLMRRSGLTSPVLARLINGDTHHLRLGDMFAMMEAMGLELDIHIQPPARERRLALAKGLPAEVEDEGLAPEPTGAPAVEPAGPVERLPNLTELVRVPSSGWDEVERALAAATDPQRKPDFRHRRPRPKAKPAAGQSKAA